MDVHGGDPHVILAIQNDSLFEAGGLIPLPDDARPTFQGRLVVEKGYMTMACGDHPVEGPDWDEMEKRALAVI